MPPKEKVDAQTFTFQEVACMIAAMNAGGVTLGNKHYSLMAKLDGERSSSGFEHKFRAVKARGKELATELNDESATPKAPKTPKSTTKKTNGTSGKKRNNKAAYIEEENEDDVVPKTPSKKQKIKKESSVEASVGASESDGNGNGVNGGHFDNAFGME